MIGDLEIHLVHNTRGKIEFGGKKIQKTDVHSQEPCFETREGKGPEEMLWPSGLHRWRAKRAVRLTLAFDWLFR
jgi:hypothetical protein